MLFQMPLADLTRHLDLASKRALPFQGQAQGGKKDQGGVAQYRFQAAFQQREIVFE